MQCWVSAILLVLCSSKVLFGNGHPEVTPELCQIEVEKEIKDGIPPVPDFLLIRWDTERCRDKQKDFLERERVDCAGSFILPECICTYHQVSNKIYHNYTACADNSKTDSINHLSCEQCKQYSENKNGPCLNGGNLLCEGNILVTEASCNCSESFSGKFCEIKTVQTYRTCFLNLDILSTQNLSVCGENILEKCKVVNGSTTFVCTLDFTEEREYPDCDSHFKNAADAMKSDKKVINCGSIQSVSFTIIFYANMLFIILYSFFSESWQ